MAMPSEEKRGATLPPFRQVNFLPVKLEVKRREDGAILLRSLNPMGDPAPHLLKPLEGWAREAPDRLWLAERPKGETQAGRWNELTYGEAWRKIRAAAAGLIELGAGPDAPVMILSGNSIPHAILTYGAHLAAAPVAPVSEAYSLMSSDFAKLKHVFDIVRPKIIFAQDYRRFASALSALDLKDVHVIAEDPPEGAQIVSYKALLQSGSPKEVEAREASLTWETVAKYLFTSGSTGLPKAVINTHGMMCVNAAMVKKLVREEEDEEPHVVLSWLPWNHTYGGNAVLNLALTNGATLYLDRGMPLPGLFDETILALREVAPTTYGNVPAAYAMLIDALEKDDLLAQTFFSRLRNVAYGGAALGQELAERFQKAAVRMTGERILFLAGYGATETGPTIMTVHWETSRMGLLGLPIPGVEIKLQPVGEKMEVRARGVCITPGYHKDADKTREAFDEEGFYKLGDAAKFLNESDPKQGLVFDGRVSEDFKLSTGTWVNAGRLRVQAIDAAGGILRDALIAGLDKNYIGVLGFPDMAAVRAFLKKEGGEDAALLQNEALRDYLRTRFFNHNEENRGSSTRIMRLLLLETPPSMDAGEITDKGYINQATALSRRAADLETLYAEPLAATVISMAKSR